VKEAYDQYPDSYPLSESLKYDQNLLQIDDDGSVQELWHKMSEN